MKPLTLVVLTITVVLGYRVTCPKLECDKDISQKKLLVGQCYLMGTENANETIHALECEDEKSESGSALTPMYCPFNLESGSYAWINESL